MMRWIGSVNECRLCTTLTCSDLNSPCIILYGRRAACCWWSVCSCCDKPEVRYRASLNLSLLRYGCQRCTLALAPHCHASAQGRSIFGKYLNAYLKFTVYGHKHGQSYDHIDTHTSMQCSPASVGLTQARPNYFCRCSCAWVCHTSWQLTKGRNFATSSMRNSWGVSESSIASPQHTIHR